MDHYLFLCSQDSKDQHPNNASTDFTVELPKTFYLDGDWEVALKEIETRISADLIYVFSDICQESYVDDTLAPILRSVRREKKSKALFTFVDPYYLPVRADYVSRIRIFIRGRHQETLRNSNTVVYCTLHLRKTRWT